MANPPKSGISWGRMRYHRDRSGLFAARSGDQNLQRPGGDLAVRLRGYTLSLRREEADRVEVEL